MNFINSIKQTMSNIHNKNSFKKDLDSLDKLKSKYISQKERLENAIFNKTGKTIDDLAKAKERVPPEYLDDLLHINDVLIKLNDVIIEIHKYRIDALFGKMNTMCKW